MSWLNGQQLWHLTVISHCMHVHSICGFIATGYIYSHMQHEELGFILKSWMCSFELTERLSLDVYWPYCPHWCCNTVQLEQLQLPVQLKTHTEETGCLHHTIINTFCVETGRRMPKTNTRIKVTQYNPPPPLKPHAALPHQPDSDSPAARPDRLSEVVASIAVELCVGRAERSC